MENMSDLILLGYVAKAFGIKGGVTVKLLNDQSQSIAIGKKVMLKLGKKPDRTLTVGDIMDGGRVFFEGIDSRSAAEEITGGELLMERAELPLIEDDEYYLFDLVGARITDTDENLLGELVGFSSNNAQTLLEVKTSAGHVASIPLVKPIVQKIDCDQKIIVIDPPIGLLDPLD